MDDKTTYVADLTLGEIAVRDKKIKKIKGATIETYTILSINIYFDIIWMWQEIHK
ncbi:hypothetical protein Back11_18100 [Paenibacillus baekrokdamisoli]|uniref:Uncharacterized protein n=1 Tax=Paenibacillus baekrokdamisoli TaxID=1712516 RepID=A0A3G9IWE0_9BACL|nr:hypothetical protein [Paenibacillus baekrokdamisoli]MBB3072404.1 hypothetical protein [Paenibacillus baekrokdamisoli]BBH20465.1 hypothetical protein Back11_18100 [Paenibacillus baekrokdamisoli]